MANQRAPAILVSALSLLLFALTAAAEQQPAPISDPTTVDWAACLDCHTDPTAGLPALSIFRPAGMGAEIAACLDCHSPLDLIGTRSDWTHPVRAVATHLNCTDCHVVITHDDRDPPPPPLGDYKAAGCYGCHREIEVKRSKMWSHSDRPGLECRDCHPPHRQLDGALPVELLPTAQAGGWLSGYDWWASNRLCLDCHFPVSIMLPLDEGFVTLNTVNYHDLHISRGRVLCVECHDPHGSDRDGMLRDKLLTGSWLGYFNRGDGGSCSVICHGVDHDGWRYINQVF